MDIVRAPWPYFGGKSRHAAAIWEGLGNPKWYIEPFAGSAAVLLNRPHKPPKGGVEVIGDADGHISNVWRSIQREPQAVAQEIKTLGPADIFTLRSIRAALESHPTACDPITAARWIYVKCADIGGGGPSVHLPNRGSGIGIFSLSNRDSIDEVFNALSARLKDVIIRHEDWSRVLSPGHINAARTTAKTIGVFIDPPYDSSSRFYENDSINEEVEAWCRLHESTEGIRIALAGRAGEYDLEGWRTIERNIYNRSKRKSTDMLYFSPGCLQSQRSLF